MKKPNINIKTLLPVLILVIILGANIYSFSQVQASKNNYKNLEKVQKDLEKTFNNTESQNTELKQELKSTDAKNNNAIKAVLPNDDEITNLNRQLEDYFNEMNSLSNPIFLQNVNYGLEKNVESKNGLYFIPFSASFSGTAKNISKTIEYMQYSGDLQRKTRLFEINKININWKGKEYGDLGLELFDFSIEGQAYFYKPI